MHREYLASLYQEMVIISLFMKYLHTPGERKSFLYLLSKNTLKVGRRHNKNKKMDPTYHKKLFH